MKLFLAAFVLGLAVALIGAKALGDPIDHEEPRPHHRATLKGHTSANDEAIDLLRRLTRQAAVGNNMETPSGANKGKWS
jgi:hypothetical protein